MFGLVLSGLRMILRLVWLRNEWHTSMTLVENVDAVVRMNALECDRMVGRRFYYERSK